MGLHCRLCRQTWNISLRPGTYPKGCGKAFDTSLLCKWLEEELRFFDLGILVPLIFFKKSFTSVGFFSWSCSVHYGHQRLGNRVGPQLRPVAAVDILQYQQIFFCSLSWRNLDESRSCPKCSGMWLLYRRLLARHTWGILKLWHIISKPNNLLGKRKTQNRPWGRVHRPGPTDCVPTVEILQGEAKGYFDQNYSMQSR